MYRLVELSWIGVLLTMAPAGTAWDVDIDVRGAADELLTAGIDIQGDGIVLIARVDPARGRSAWRLARWSWDPCGSSG